MNNKNFTATFLVDQTPEEVFDAVNNVRGWWSETVVGGTDKLNDEFEYRHGDVHYSKHRITELTPAQKVVWLTTDSHLSFVKKTDEWTGTEIVFEISEQGGKTQLVFTHIGLNPEKECFEDCSGGGGWGYYLGSLINLISTGKGQPDTAKTMNS